MVRAVAILLTLFPEIFCGTLWDLTATSKNQCSSEKKLFNLKNIFTASRQFVFFFLIIMFSPKKTFVIYSH